MSEEKNVFKILRELKKFQNVSVHLNEESTITEKLTKAGIHRERLLSFLKRNIEHNREVLEIRRGAMEDDEYYREKLELIEVEIFIFYLEGSL